MLTPETIRELRSQWLPNVTDAGLDRLIELLEKNSPLLVHGCFTRAVPMGCLATQIAWHHPETAHFSADAGINWMHRVAGLNPATSQVIRAWDAGGPHSWETRADLLTAFRNERRVRREKRAPVPKSPVLAEV
jgi:hypothetical protein